MYRLKHAGNFWVPSGPVFHWIEYWNDLLILIEVQYMLRKTTLALSLMVIATLAHAEVQTKSIAVVKKTNESCRQQGDSCVPLSTGDQIYVGDTVKTKSQGYTGISFEDGTTVALGDKTEFNVKDYKYAPLNKTYAFNVTLRKGKALYTSGRVGKLSPESVSIHTPTAVIAVRGTRFLVTAD